MVAAAVRLDPSPEITPEGTDARLAALQRYDVLDTPGESAFERIASLIQLVFKVDTSIVSMIDGHRQWYKAANGIGITEVPLADTFCRVTVEGHGPMVVCDASQDARFRDNPMVTGDAHIRFYAGVPLTTPDGHNIGTLCAIGRQPREFGPEEQAILSQFAQIAMNELELRQLATTDGLTGALTRRAFKEDASRFVALARRHRSRLSCVAFDIDFFKRINDTYGHAAGDQVLQAVARAAREQLRATDLFGRLGGEEFAALLPDTDAAGAAEVAEKLRAAVRALKFPGSHPPIGVTASFGVATRDPGADDIDSLPGKADEAVYEAKNIGRNRTVTWRGSTTATTRYVDRRRVLKAGRLIFNERRSTVDCTVRSLWQTGAEIDVSTTVGLPDELTLELKVDRFTWACRVTDRKPAKLEVEFI